LHWLSLEFLRANHRNEQVGEQQQRDDANNDCAHIALEFVAEAHVKSAHHEEKDNGSREDEVVHDC
jgi:hypothetical protein